VQCVRGEGGGKRKDERREVKGRGEGEGERRKFSGEGRGGREEKGRVKEERREG
jgi:hypothetical protein